MKYLRIHPGLSYIYTEVGGRCVRYMVRYLGTTRKLTPAVRRMFFAKARTVGGMFFGRPFETSEGASMMPIVVAKTARKRDKKHTRGINND